MNLHGASLHQVGMSRGRAELFHLRVPDPVREDALLGMR